MNARGLPKDLCDLFLVAYNRLRVNSLADKFSVAVRSSALDEDGMSASFAGQYRTYLNLSGELSVANAIVDCWRSADSSSVLEYHRQKGLAINNPRIAVIIQEMVHSDVSAVAFSANPVTGNRSEILINAN